MSVILSVMVEKYVNISVTLSAVGGKCESINVTLSTSLEEHVYYECHSISFNREIYKYECHFVSYIREICKYEYCWFGWLVLLLYVPSQQLWSLRDGQFT